MNIRDRVSRALGGRDGQGEDGAENVEVPDALTLLHNDHQEVEALFDRVLGGDPGAQRGDVQRILEMLELHTAMEEQLFYPELRDEGGEEEDDSVLEAYEEHDSAKELIAKIRGLRGRDETLKAKLTVLREQVLHHVQEEESQIFDEARRTLGEERLHELGAEMMEFKESGGRRRGRGGAGARKKTAARGGARKTAGAARGGAKTSGAPGRGGAKKSAGAARGAAKESAAGRGAAKKSGGAGRGAASKSATGGRGGAKKSGGAGRGGAAKRKR